ncbi:MAG TPA: GNAT family N-acetyltransferase, partial [Oligoflexus sp.]|uniref:GNAT family N-acetyltransferase n=1 Tax=Oligoflexus sp. TaxID=1971216 RepID=UPI002D384566
ARRFTISSAAVKSLSGDIVKIRKLKINEGNIVFPIIQQLRTELTLTQFIEKWERVTEHGYCLIGAFIEGTLVGVIGFRPVETLARGRHLHVDDLVIHDSRRGSGIGQALLQHVEDLALRGERLAVFLDSRPEAMGFYEKLGYSLHPAPLVRKRLTAKPNN